LGFALFILRFWLVCGLILDKDASRRADASVAWARKKFAGMSTSAEERSPRV
jgi:hypothetical protein